MDFGESWGLGVGYRGDHRLVLPRIPALFNLVINLRPTEIWRFRVSLRARVWV